MKKLLIMVVLFWTMVACNSEKKEAQKEVVDVSTPVSEKLIGVWVIPKNKHKIAIEFRRDGRFVFQDYNANLKGNELLEGNYTLFDNDDIDIIFDDRSKLTFTYQTDDDNKKFWIQNRKGTYKFIKYVGRFDAYISESEDSGIQTQEEESVESAETPTDSLDKQ